MNSRLKLVLAVSCLMNLMACGGGGGDSSSSASSSSPTNSGPNSSGPTTGLSVSLKSQGGIGAAALSEQPIPLWFGTLSVTAFHYRPNQSKQAGIGSNTGYIYFQSSNWSMWQLLAANYEGGRDFLLPSGGNVDLRSKAGSRFYRDIDEEYVDQVGSFSFDVIEIFGTPSLINQNNDVCGPYYIATAATVIPEGLNFSSPCVNRWVKSTYDGTYLWGRQSYFIRNDWIGVPIQLTYYSDVGSQVQCFSTDVPLTAFQEELLISLLKDVRQNSGWDPTAYYSNHCTQRRQETVSLVPQATDVAVIQFNQSLIPQEPLITADGISIPRNPTRIVSQNIEMSVGFNLLPSMIVDYSAFNNSNSPADIMVRPAADGSYWGVSVGFESLGTSGH